MECVRWVFCEKERLSILFVLGKYGHFVRAKDSLELSCRVLDGERNIRPNSINTVNQECGVCRSKSLFEFFRRTDLINSTKKNNQHKSDCDSDYKNRVKHNVFSASFT